MSTEKPKGFWKQLAQVIKDEFETSAIGFEVNSHILNAKLSNERRQEGRDARSASLQMDNNPYTDKTERKDWDQGWIDEDQRILVVESHRQEESARQHEVHKRICVEEGKASRCSSRARDSNPYKDNEGKTAWHEGWDGEHRRICLDQGRAARKKHFVKADNPIKDSIGKNSWDKGWSEVHEACSTEEGKLARSTGLFLEKNPHSDPIGKSAWSKGWIQEADRLRQQCYGEGVKARSEGRNTDSNPYAHQDDHQAWNAGWQKEHQARVEKEHQARVEEEYQSRVEMEKAAKDYYEILQVSPRADHEVIKAAYGKLAIKYHPDRNIGNLESERMMKTLNEAKEVLLDPVRRSNYDKKKKAEAERPQHSRSQPEAPSTPKQDNPPRSQKRVPTAEELQNMIDKAAVLRMTRQWSEAVTYATYMIDNFITSEGYYARATAYNQIGNQTGEVRHFQQSMQDYSKVIEIGTPNSELLASAYYNRGCIKTDDLNDHSGAILDFQMVLRFAPAYAGVHAGIARAEHGIAIAGKGTGRQA